MAKAIRRREGWLVKTEKEKARVQNKAYCLLYVLNKNFQVHYFMARMTTHHFFKEPRVSLSGRLWAVKSLPLIPVLISNRSPFEFLDQGHKKTEKRPRVCYQVFTKKRKHVRLWFGALLPAWVSPTPLCHYLPLLAWTICTQWLKMYIKYCMRT